MRRLREVLGWRGRGKAFFSFLFFFFFGECLCCELLFFLALRNVSMIRKFLLRAVLPGGGRD